MGRYACLTALIVVLVVAGIANWLAHSPMFIQHPEAALPSCSEELQRSRQLDRDRDRNIYAREERFRIITQLERETISFHEAIEFFRPLNEYDPVVLTMLRTHHPERSDEEILGYQVVVAAHAQPRTDEDGRRALLRKLIAQQHQRFGAEAMVPKLALDEISKDKTRRPIKN